MATHAYGINTCIWQHMHIETHAYGKTRTWQHIHMDMATHACSNTRIWQHTHMATHLGFMFNSNGQDDEDMLRQMRNAFKQVITYFSLLFF